MCNRNLYKHFSVTESERLMSEFFGEVTICSLILSVMCKPNKTKQAWRILRVVASWNFLWRLEWRQRNIREVCNTCKYYVKKASSGRQCVHPEKEVGLGHLDGDPDEVVYWKSNCSIRGCSVCHWVGAGKSWGGGKSLARICVTESESWTVQTVPQGQ